MPAGHHSRALPCGKTKVPSSRTISYMGKPASESSRNAISHTNAPAAPARIALLKSTTLSIARQRSRVRYVAHSDPVAVDQIPALPPAVEQDQDHGSRQENA